MSLNKYMHPRNIYRNPPNFKELAITYPEFRRHAKQELSGKVSLDFKDPAALKALTCTLLSKDFGLEIDIPPDRLVPTLPLRLNYLLWIEDLLEAAGINSAGGIHGIDIGTGASCIYPLLGAKQNSWKMTASEVDDQLASFAQRNVEKNNLQDLILVKKVDSNVILKGVVDPEQRYHFTMCNPPFFASNKDLEPGSKSRSPNRPKPRNARTGMAREVVVEGGEVAFVQNMIKESAELGSSVRIYTTMVGHKSSLGPLKMELHKQGAQVTQTEFCQGHTMRWGLAWTFCKDIYLENVQAVKKKKKEKPPLRYVIPENTSNVEYTFKTMADAIRRLLLELKMKLHEVKKTETLDAYNAKAMENTWMHQRRKRREKLHELQPTEEKTASAGDSEELVSCSDVPEDENKNVNQDSIVESMKTPTVPNNKRSAGDCEDKLPLKRSKTNETEDSESSMNSREVEECESLVKEKEKEETNQGECVLRMFVNVTRLASKISLEMQYLEGTGGRESVHQVLQYVKNKLK